MGMPIKVLRAYSDALPIVLAEMKANMAEVEMLPYLPPQLRRRTIRMWQIEQQSAPVFSRQEHRARLKMIGISVEVDAIPQDSQEPS